jgi:CRP-like cAMP-binding protein
VITEIPTRRLLEDFLKENETRQNFGGGVLLFSEGDPARGIYVIHEGTADLLFRARTGEMKGLRHARAGEILGLEAILAERPHDCTARTHGACELGFIDKETFLGLLERSPFLWFSVLRLLSRDLNASYDSLRQVAVSR